VSKYIGVMSISNTMGMSIRISDSGEEVQYRWSDSGEWSEFQEIFEEYPEDSEDEGYEPYFIIDDTKYYINDFMRVEDTEDAENN
jgi:hypothetical protein